MIEDDVYEMLSQREMIIDGKVRLDINRDGHGIGGYSSEESEDEYHRSPRRGKYTDGKPYYNQLLARRDANNDRLDEVGLPRRSPQAKATRGGAARRGNPGLRYEGRVVVRDVRSREVRGALAGVLAGARGGVDGADDYDRALHYIQSRRSYSDRLRVELAEGGAHHLFWGGRDGRSPLPDNYSGGGYTRGDYGGARGRSPPPTEHGWQPGYPREQGEYDYSPEGRSGSELVREALERTYLGARGGEGSGAAGRRPPGARAPAAEDGIPYVRDRESYTPADLDDDPPLGAAGPGLGGGGGGGGAFAASGGGGGGGGVAAGRVDLDTSVATDTTIRESLEDRFSIESERAAMAAASAGAAAEARAGLHASPAAAPTPAPRERAAAAAASASAAAEARAGLGRAGLGAAATAHNWSSTLRGGGGSGRSGSAHRAPGPSRGHTPHGGRHTGGGGRHSQEEDALVESVRRRLHKVAGGGVGMVEAALRAEYDDVRTPHDIVAYDPPPFYGEDALTINEDARGRLHHSFWNLKVANEDLHHDLIMLNHSLKGEIADAAVRRRQRGGH